MKYKTVRWYKEGSQIPIGGTLVKIEVRTERGIAPEGGYITTKKYWFLYEVKSEWSRNESK